MWIFLSTQIPLVPHAFKIYKCKVNLDRLHNAPTYLGSALFKYCNIHVRAQKGYRLEQACTKCMYKRHFAIKQEVDIHEAGDKANKNISKVRIYAFTCSRRLYNI